MEETEKQDEHITFSADLDCLSDDNGGNKTGDLLYNVEDNPGWTLSFFNALQHCLLAVTSMIAMPFIFAPYLCMFDDDVGYLGRAMIINTLIFVSGITTFIQTTIGIRLPVMHGASTAFFSPTVALLTLPQNVCPGQSIMENVTNVSTVKLFNDTDGSTVDGTELWQKRMREMQGAIIVSSMVEIVLSATGVCGYLMKFIGPLTVAPSVTLVGLTLVDIAGTYSSGHWGISLLTIALLVAFSQYLKNIKVLMIPVRGTEKRCHLSRIRIFKIFPVLITILLVFILCLLLTEKDLLPSEPETLGYKARTDIKLDVLWNAPWVYLPYPGQWGVPVITGAGVVGMVVAAIISIVEVIGDFYACARISSKPPPPIHAFNRGLTVKGFGSLLSGLFGSTCGTTSYTQNIALVGITRVASRRVLQMTGIILIVIGMLGKFGAVLVVIPDPIMGGLFCTMFGMIVAVGISSLQYVDLNSSRNLFVIGFPVMMGLTVPEWMKDHPGIIQTGHTELDQILTVLLETKVFLGFFLACFFDNTLAGTLEERGMVSWSTNKKQVEHETNDENSGTHFYELPFKTNCCRFSKYIPILPEFGNRKTQAVNGFA